MNAADDSDPFYATVSVFRSFRNLMDPQLYTPLPDDWTIGVADIAQSTEAIRENRYKAVNMAGAAVIAAVKNALKGREFPYVFGGDGASFAVPPRYLARACEALAATATWVKEDLDLAMRVALERARAWSRRPRGALRAFAKRLLRNVFGRRLGMGRCRHETR